MLKQQTFISSLFWRLEVWDQGLGMVSFMEASLLGLQTVIFTLFVHLVVPLCVCPNFCSYKDTIELGSTHMNSSHLDYLFKRPIYKYSHLLRYWGSGLQHRNFRWTHFSPTRGKETILLMFLSFQKENYCQKS